MTTRSTCSASTASAASSARSAPASWSIRRSAAPASWITPLGKIADYDFVAQMTSQLWGVCTTLVWSGIGSAILYKVVDVIVGLRVNVETEREGLDVTEHTERAYNM